MRAAPRWPRRQAGGYCRGMGSRRGSLVAAAKWLHHHEKIRERDGRRLTLPPAAAMAPEYV